MPLTESVGDLQAHQRRVTHIEWHPTAEHVLFSAGYDYQIFVWDTCKMAIIQAMDIHTDVIYSMSINRNGSSIATTSRDKRLRIIDPRSGKLLQEGVCHEGSKACKVVYLGETGMVFTTGFSNFSDRQYAVWDEKDLSSPLAMEAIDSSCSILTPFYDHDTRVVFVAGKGDGNIRYYEITTSPPYCHFLNQYMSSEPQRGLGVMPKRGCKVNICEIFRFYKLHASKAICEPISMIVPRKSDQFQPDIYPDTASPTPALSAEEWFSGITKGPVLMSLKTGLTIKTHRPLPLQPNQITSDKNADKKYAFLSMETRADYRPMEFSRSSSIVNTGKEWVKQISSDKDMKTSTNLDTKFQALQKLWGCNVKNLPDMEVCSSTGCESSITMVTSKQESSRKLSSYYASQEKEFGYIQKPSPKSEAELRRAYTAQCEELKLLRRQLFIKDRRIRDLEDQLNQFKGPRK